MLLYRLRSTARHISRHAIPCCVPIFAIALSVGLACAQSSLPSAPQPKVPQPVVASETAQTTPVTMAPHHGNDRWWLSGQANIIFQGNLPFHSPYVGTNSFRGASEYKTSLLGTLYSVVRPTSSIRYNTDLIVDLESAGGRGVSQALGLAGFTNLDVVRNPTLSTAPYLARYQIHQVFGLTGEITSQGPISASTFGLASSMPVRRFELRLGKLTLPDFFDANSPGSDSHLQFMNWTVDNNGAWDYAANTRGYTVGGIAEYDDRKWSLRYGLFAMPKVANGMDLEWNWRNAHGHNGEFELRHSYIAQRRRRHPLALLRQPSPYGHLSRGDSGFLNGTDTANYGVTVPTITLHEHIKALKYGFGYNTEQELTEALRVLAASGGMKVSMSPSPTLR